MCMHYIYLFQNGYNLLVFSNVMNFGFRRVWLSLQPGHHSNLPAPTLQPTANQERNEQCGNQHYSRELLMMGIVVS